MWDRWFLLVDLTSPSAPTVLQRSCTVHQSSSSSKSCMRIYKLFALDPSPTVAPSLLSYVASGVPAHWCRSATNTDIVALTSGCTLTSSIVIVRIVRIGMAMSRKLDPDGALDLRVEVELAENSRGLHATAVPVHGRGVLKFEAYGLSHCSLKCKVHLELTPREGTC